MFILSLPFLYKEIHPFIHMHTLQQYINVHTLIGHRNGDGEERTEEKELV